MFKRPRAIASSFEPGSVFKLVGEDKCLQVIDLTQVDGFKESPVLRQDVIYCSDVETGVVRVIPKNVDVEKVDLEISETVIQMKRLPDSWGSLERREDE
jgi:hypothetical protein